MIASFIHYAARILPRIKNIQAMKVCSFTKALNEAS